MKRSHVLGLLAGLAVSVLSSNFASASNWNEQASGTFGAGSLPAGGAAEYYLDSFGFGAYYYDVHGRVVSNAETTINSAGDALTRISPTLWSGTDVDMFKILITDPSTFSAYTNNTTNKLALFDSTGKALAASTGGTLANGIIGSTIPGLVAGQYFIAESNIGGQPKNAAGTNIFDFTSTGEVFPLGTVTDQVLATDPYTAWGLSNTTTAGGPYLIGPSSFTTGNSQIYLAGTNYSAIPEPTSLSLLALAGFGALGRRRKAK